MTQDAPTKTITLELWRDDGSNIDDDEYSVRLVSFSEPLDLLSPGGTDDISLVMEGLVECLKRVVFPPTSYVRVTMKESGEWEDVFWHKYYVLERQEIWLPCGMINHLCDGCASVGKAYCEGRQPSWTLKINVPNDFGD